MNEIVRSARSVRVYACGGAALNITASLQNAGEDANPGFAKLIPCFVDTSNSNASRIKPENYFKVEGVYDNDDAEVDGAGKNRAFHADRILASIPAVLLKFQPADLNIVVHSLSGGTGSVAGPALVDELLRRGETVIVLLINSTDSEKEVDNSYKTMMTYERISSANERPVCAMFLENNQLGSQSAVDRQMVVNILTLVGIWSGQNSGLDSKDLKNFLEYQTVTHYKPTLTYLSILDGDARLEADSSHLVVSMATLVNGGQDATPPMMVGYHTSGVMTPALAENLKIKAPIRMVATVGPFAEHASRMKKMLDRAEEARKAAISKTIRVETGGNIKSNIIL